MPTITSFCIRDEASFLDLAKRWNQLADKTDSRSVFLRHEWFDATWNWIKNACELAIICVLRDDELIGIGPFVLRHTTQVGMTVTVLEFLAVPDTQECSLIMDPADLDAVLAEMTKYLSSGDIHWDIMRLEKLRADSPMIPTLAAMVRRVSCAVQILDGDNSPGIALDDEWQSYYGRRSRRLKKGNNHIVNRLKRDNKQFEIRCYDHAASSGYELSWLIDTLVNLSASSWKVSTGLTLDQQGPGAFINRLTEHAMRNAWLLVWILTIDGKPAAMEYQLEFNGIVSGLRADYDSHFDGYSPGTLLNWKIIEQLFQREASFYSLGPGSNEYKKRWAEEQQRLNTVVAYGNSACGLAACAVEMYMRPLASRIMRLLNHMKHGRK